MNSLIEFGVYIFDKPEKKCQESRYIVRMYYKGYHYRPERCLSSIQTCGSVDINQPLPWFSRVGYEKILSPFLEHSEENVGV